MLTPIALRPPGSTHPRLPEDFWQTLRRLDVPPTRFVLNVRIQAQTMSLFEQVRANRLIRVFHAPARRLSALAATREIPGPRWAAYRCLRHYRVSTSAYGIGQELNSNHTPLGLHRLAIKAGGGWPIGTVFRGRKPVGLTWGGMPEGTIVHRILWLEGLEPGFNQGGTVDTFRRYIYIHGFGDEATLGRPKSHGCIHLAAKDLFPLFDFIPTGTLVWITRR